MFGIKIYTPEKFFLDGTADSLVCCGLDGEICILQNHASMILVVREGIMKVRTGDKTKNILTGKGFVEVNGNNVDVFVEFCAYEEDASAEKLNAQTRYQREQDSISDHKYREIALARQVSEFGKAKNQYNS